MTPRRNFASGALGVNFRKLGFSRQPAASAIATLAAVSALLTSVVGACGSGGDAPSTSSRHGSTTAGQTVFVAATAANQYTFGHDSDTRCGLAGQEWTLVSEPRSFPGYELLVLITPYRGHGEYRDLRSDLEAPTGVRVLLFNLAEPQVKQGAGVGTGGVVTIDSASGDTVTGSLKVQMFAVSGRFELTGIWTCRISDVGRGLVVPTPQRS